MSPVRRPLALVALSALVALAGCGFATTDAGTPTPTVTPAPVPTVTSHGTPATDPAAAGVDGGVADPWAFAQTHRRALWRTSYTVSQRWGIVAGNETLQAATRQVRVERGGDRYLLVQRASHDGYPTMRAAGPEFGVWRAEDRGWYRLAGPNHTQYGRLDGVRGRDDVEPTDDERIASLLTAFEVTERRLATARFVRYRLESTGLSDPAALDLPPGLSDPRDATLSMLVDPAGIVRAYRLSYRATYRDRPVRVFRTFQVGDVGTTTASPPDWLPAARNATR